MAYFETIKLTGNTGATVDQAPGSAVPTNAIAVGGTDGTNLRLILLDSSGRPMVNIAQYSGQAVVTNGVNGLIATGNYGTSATSDASWTSSTTVNTAVTLVNNITGYSSLLVTLNQAPTGTLTGGVVTFQASNDNSNWFNVQGVQQGTTTIIGPTFTLVQGAYNAFQFPVIAPYFRVLLSVAITGTGTVTVGHALTTLPAMQIVTGAFSGSLNDNVQQWNGVTVDTNSGTKSAGTLRVVLATDQPALTNKLLVTPDSVALPAHQSTNVDQLNGTTTDTNSGSKSAGTLRVVLATDQPALTNKLLVTPDSVALPLHQSVNVDQLNGTTTDTNSGSKSAGTLRVVLATDQPALTNKLLVTPDSVALPAHQSVNVDQLNGTTTDTNSGNKSAGTLRVVLATDQPALTAKLLVTPDSVALPAHQSVNVDQWNGTTLSAATAGIPDVNLKNIGNTAISNTTAGIPDVNVKNIGNSAVSTAGAGIQKVGLVGNAASTLDSTVGSGTAPSNAIAVSGIYSTTQPTPTNSQATAIQQDQAANALVFNGVALKTLSAQGTALNSTQTIFSLSGCVAVMVQLTQTTTLTAGAVTFEFTYDGSNWSAVPANCVVDPTSTTFAQISIPYTVQASTNKQFLILCNGATGLRIRTSTQITGTGSVTPNYALLNSDPLVQASIATALPSGTNTVGKVNCLGNAGAIFDGATAASVPANAVQAGARAATAYPTAVTDGQLVAPMADKAGRTAVVLNAPRDLIGTVQVNSSSSSLVTFIAAGATGVFNDISTFTATNESSTATIVNLSDQTTTYKYAIAGNGGIVINFPTPLPAASSALAWQVANSAGVAVDYTAVFIKNK